MHVVWKRVDRVSARLPLYPDGLLRLPRAQGSRVLNAPAR